MQATHLRFEQSQYHGSAEELCSPFIDRLELLFAYNLWEIPMVELFSLHTSLPTEECSDAANKPPGHLEGLQQSAFPLPHIKVVDDLAHSIEYEFGLTLPLLLP